MGGGVADPILFSGGHGLAALANHQARPDLASPEAWLGLTAAGGQDGPVSLAGPS
jgi:hypothetical protein